jgi:hypothetical protein
MKIGIYSGSLDLRGIDGTIDNLDWNNLNLLFGGNSGNMVFKYAIEHQIEGDFIFYRWGTPAKKINSEVDIIVLPAANQLGLHTDLKFFANQVEQLTIPMVVIGLGAQAKSLEDELQLNEGTLNWLKAILNNGKKFGINNIYTRGPYTTKEIKRLTGRDTIPGGCPSFFMNKNPKLGQRIQQNLEDRKDRRNEVSIASADYNKSKMKDVEAYLLSFLEKDNFNGKYIIQHPDGFMKIGLGDYSDKKAFDKAKNFLSFEGSDIEFEHWLRRRGKVFRSVQGWIEHLSEVSFVIGMRYHGVALALQAGTLGIVLTIDSRTEELSEQTGVPYLNVSDLDLTLSREQLYEKVNFDPQKYDQFRKNKAKLYKDFLKYCGLVPQKYLIDLAT